MLFVAMLISYSVGAGLATLISRKPEKKMLWIVLNAVVMAALSALWFYIPFSFFFFMMVHTMGYRHRFFQLAAQKLPSKEQRKDWDDAIKKGLM